MEHRSNEVDLALIYGMKTYVADKKVQASTRANNFISDIIWISLDIKYGFTIAKRLYFSLFCLLRNIEKEKFFKRS